MITEIGRRVGLMHIEDHLQPIFPWMPGFHWPETPVVAFSDETLEAQVWFVGSTGDCLPLMACHPHAVFYTTTIHEIAMTVRHLCEMNTPQSITATAAEITERSRFEPLNLEDPRFVWPNGIVIAVKSDGSLAFTDHWMQARSILRTDKDATFWTPITAAYVTQSGDFVELDLNDPGFTWPNGVVIAMKSDGSLAFTIHWMQARDILRDDKTATFWTPAEEALA